MESITSSFRRAAVGVGLQLLFVSSLWAQISSEPALLPAATASHHQFFVGTQIPLQYTAGYAYQFNNRFSARAQVGVLTKPYDQYIVRLMEAFGMEKNLGRVIERSFRSGTLLGLGVNYHAGKNYAGLSGQYINLRGAGITPADGLGIFFKQDFSGFGLSSLPAFEFTMQSNLFNLGVLYGRQIPLPNPRWRIDAEVGVAKVVASGNTFASNRPLIDRTGLTQGLYRELDRQLKKSYWQYGWLPTVSVYLVYQL